MLWVRVRVVAFALLYSLTYLSVVIPAYDHKLIYILLSLLWLEINPCLILVPTMYRTWLYDKRFGRYDVFSINHPNHPWGTLDSLGVPPLTSTPLPSGRPKLSQRQPQIRGHFWPSSSCLGATAPAPLRSLFGAQGSCFQDALLSLSLLTLYRERHCSLLLIEVFLCLGHWSWSLVTWLSCDQTVMAATMAPSLGQIAYLRDFVLSFWFLFLSQEG